MKTQFNLNRLTFFALLATLFLAGSAFGSPKDGDRAATYKRSSTKVLSSEIRSLIDSPSESLREKLVGEAEVFFTVDEQQLVHVKGIFSTSDALSAYVEQKLDGAFLKRNGAVPGQEYRMKLRMVDFR